MLQEKEEQLLKKRMIELAGLCYQRDIQTSTGFLSLNEQTIFHSIEKTLPPVRTCLTGGFEGAERKLLCFLASYDDEEFGLPIAVLEVIPANLRYSEALTHRDYLGALMNLGIERGYSDEGKWLLRLLPGKDGGLSLPGTHDGAPHLRDLPQGGRDGADHTEDGAREWKRCITAS